MKNFLGILVLGLVLTSCSEYMAEQKLEYCADTEYSKEMTKPLNLYLYIKNKRADNEFEMKILRLKAAEVTHGELIGLISNEIHNPEKTSQDFKDTIKRYDNEIKKFLNSNLDQKLKKSPVIHYKYLFSQCELERIETPKTFDARWKKADIKYLGNIINK